MRIGYCRVSRREQSERSNALEQQRKRIEREGVDKIIIEVESGYKGKEREGLRELMELVKHGIAKEVLITRLDRLGRSVLELNKIVAQMQNKDCVLRALDDNIDLNTVDGRLHFNILASFAQSESDRLSERVKHGFQDLRDRQLTMSKIPFGYSRVDGKYVLDTQPFISTLEDRQEYSKCMIAQKIVGIYIKTKSITGTLSQLLKYYGFQIMSYDGLRYWLKNPVLDGHTVYKTKGEIHYNTHPFIVSPSVRQEIELTKNQSTYTKRHSSTFIYPYSGKVYCYCCGSNCVVATGKKRKEKYYHCKQSVQKKIDCKNTKYTSIELIDKAFIQELIKCSDQLLQLVSRERTEVESPELLHLRSQREALLAIPSNPAIDKAIREIESQIHKLESITYSKTHNNKVLAVLSSTLFWETLNTSDKKNIVWLLVDKILILDGNVQQIQFKREYESNYGRI